jgi:hypothetical protein
MSFNALSYRTSKFAGSFDFTLAVFDKWNTHMVLGS